MPESVLRYPFPLRHAVDIGCPVVNTRVDSRVDDIADRVGELGVRASLRVSQGIGGRDREYESVRPEQVFQHLGRCG